MLPCNVIVREAEGGSEVAAIDPVASMQAIDNPEPGRIAGRVHDLLRGAVDKLWPAPRQLRLLRAGCTIPRMAAIRGIALVGTTATFS
jgi:hypothetical protein